MQARAARRPPWKIALRIILGVLLSLLVLLAAWALSLWIAMGQSRPLLEGRLPAEGLSGPVTISRDAAGVPTISGQSRADVAYALGFLHGQERFFQMEALRRAAAGELSELLGPPTLGIDRQVRVHRFRARAAAIVAAMQPEERQLLDRYVAGVNAGLTRLNSRPFEHRALFKKPEPWLPEDTVLAVFAMYLNLQPAQPTRELDRALAEKRGGRALADFLFPSTTPLDAPIDGSTLPAPPIPASLGRAAGPPAEVGEAPVPGSNNWAVSGALSSSGAALIANDMHLGTQLPNTWYRARLVVAGALDATGVTLPGTPFIVAGSTGRIAWGFTNSYIDTADAVIIEESRPGFYKAPGGDLPFRTYSERLSHRTGSEALTIRETIWGPVVATDALGRQIAMRWTAHQPDAVSLAPFLALERAQTVEEAVAIAQRAAIPQQNFVVGDRAGNIAWTIIGQVPARFGFSGRDAVSFADGSRGWRGILPPGQVPIVRNPPSGRIWTANSRVVGGEAFQILGDGGYDNGGRAGRIRDRLFASERFAPADFLSIQLDDVSVRNRFWRDQLLTEIERRPDDAALQAMRPFVADWGGRALPESVGFRLVDRFRRAVVYGVYEAYLGGVPEGRFRRTYAPSQAEGAVRRLLIARPEGLVPPSHASWTAFLDSTLDTLKEEVGGDPKGFRWGETARAGVRHPLSRLVPGLGLLTDPQDRAVPGDTSTVRAQAPGFGASERFAVSPGFESEGLFHMPGGQAGNPRSPYYLAGHEDWLEGRATPFLPGKPRWSLVLEPAP
jgi:penicillin amidase